MPCTGGSDKPVNIVVNANGAGADDGLAFDHRICHFCKRGIMERKKYVLFHFLSVGNRSAFLCSQLESICYVQTESSVKKLASNFL